MTNYLTPYCCNSCSNLGDNLECNPEECDKLFRYRFDQMIETTHNLDVSDSELIKILEEVEG